MRLEHRTTSGDKAEGNQVGTAWAALFSTVTQGLQA